jgi:hypothetical protein
MVGLAPNRPQEIEGSARGPGTAKTRRLVVIRTNDTQTTSGTQNRSSAASTSSNHCRTVG